MKRGSTGGEGEEGEGRGRGEERGRGGQGRERMNSREREVKETEINEYYHRGRIGKRKRKAEEVTSGQWDVKLRQQTWDATSLMLSHITYNHTYTQHTHTRKTTCFLSNVFIELSKVKFNNLLKCISHKRCDACELVQAANWSCTAPIMWHTRHDTPPSPQPSIIHTHLIRWSI